MPIHTLSVFSTSRKSANLPFPREPVIYFPCMSRKKAMFQKFFVGPEWDDCFRMPNAAFKVWMRHYAREQGGKRESWPSLLRLALECDMSKETVVVARRWLVANGWLVKVRERNSSHGEFGVPVFRVEHGSIPRSENPTLTRSEKPARTGAEKPARTRAEKPSTDRAGKTVLESEQVESEKETSSTTDFSQFLSGLQEILPSIDTEAGARLWDDCRRRAPDCRVEEVLHFVRLKATVVQGGKIHNPAGFLLHAVPKCLDGPAFTNFRQAREKADQRKPASSAVSAERMGELLNQFPSASRTGDCPWPVITGRLRGKINPHSFDTWLAPTRGAFAANDGHVLVISVPTEEFRHARQKFGAEILEEAGAFGFREVEFLTRDEAEAVWQARSALLSEGDRAQWWEARSASRSQRRSAA